MSDKAHSRPMAFTAARIAATHALDDLGEYVAALRFSGIGCADNLSGLLAEVRQHVAAMDKEFSGQIFDYVGAVEQGSRNVISAALAGVEIGQRSPR